MPDEGLAPSLLLAMPQLDDPNFNRAVVLLCRHNEEGALGFIVNRPVHVTAKELLALDPPLETDTPLSRVGGWSGEPGARLAAVPPGAVRREQPRGVQAACSCRARRPCCDASSTAIRATASPIAAACSSATRAGGPVSSTTSSPTSSWLNAPLDLDMVFTTPPEDLWERAIRSLGVEPTAIAAAPGIH